MLVGGGPGGVRVQACWVGGGMRLERLVVAPAGRRAAHTFSRPLARAHGPPPHLAVLQGRHLRTALLQVVQAGNGPGLRGAERQPPRQAVHLQVRVLARGVGWSGRGVGTVAVMLLLLTADVAGRRLVRALVPIHSFRTPACQAAPPPPLPTHRIVIFSPICLFFGPHLPALMALLHPPFLQDLRRVGSGAGLFAVTGHEAATFDFSLLEPMDDVSVVRTSVRQCVSCVRYVSFALCQFCSCAFLLRVVFAVVQL